MPDLLRVTVRFLQPFSHGRGEGGEPEWPPSPLRLFQALVAASAARWNERMLVEYAAPALGWLEGLARPDIVAPAGVASGNPYLAYVPDNTAELCVPAWKAGNVRKEPKRVEKPVRPTNLAGDALHYLFPLVTPGEVAGLETHLAVLRAAASSVTHLGWGVDQVLGEAAAASAGEAAGLAGERWRPVAAGGVPLRVPAPGTFDDLSRKHAQFLGRLEGGGFRPVAPLACFAVVGYHSATAAGPTSSPLPYAAFEVRRTVADVAARPSGSRFRPFAALRFQTVAGMVRHAAAGAARKMGVDESRVRSLVEGHGAGEGEMATTDERLMFLPLPTISAHGGRVEAIRRVLVVAPAGFDAGALARRLDGEQLHQLREDGSGRSDPVAALALLPPGDPNVAHYVGESAVWSTVTPVALPGRDDPAGLRRRLRAGVAAGEQRRLLGRLDARVLGLVRKSLIQCGCAPELVAGAGIEYRAGGFLPGVELAGRYRLPPLHYPQYHVRVSFERPVHGPLAIGAGRYRGLGLFAPG